MKRFVIVQNSIRTVYLFRLPYIKELLKTGNVIIIAPIDDDYAYKELKKLSVFIYEVPKQNNKFNKISSIIKMNAFILKERYNGSFFICHFIVTFLSCYFSLVPLNKKLLIYTEGLGSIFLRYPWARYLLKFLLVRNNAVRLFCNKSERDLLGNKDDIITNGIGVDIDKFKNKFRKNINENYKYKLIYIGRLIKDKGVIDIIDAFKILKIKNYNVELTLVGDIYPNNPSSLSEKEIDSIKSEFGNDIRFVSFTNDIKKLYELSDILLLASYREGFPVCVMEASSMGLPSVGYIVPGVEDAIIPGTNGLLAEFKNINELAYMIESLLQKDILEKYKTSSVNYANENFDSKLKAQELIDVVLTSYK